MRGNGFLVVLNLGQDPHTIDLSQVATTAVIAVQTHMARGGPVDLAALTVNPNEGLLLQLEK